MSRHIKLPSTSPQSSKAGPAVQPQAVVPSQTGTPTPHQPPDVADSHYAAPSLPNGDDDFRALAEAVPQVVWATGPDGLNVYCNQRWVDYTGLTLEETYGNGWTKAYHPEDRAAAEEAWRSAVHGEIPYSVECRLRRADGIYRWWLICGAPTRDADGKIQKWFGTCTDVEELKRTEESLRIAHQRFETVLGSITDGLAVLDTGWRYTYVNEQASRIIGLRPDQVLGACIWDLFPQALGTRFEEGYRRAVATGHRVEIEEYYPHPINKWLKCICYPSSEGLSVYFHDVTARKQVEATIDQNEKLFATLIEQAPLGVYVVDAQFRLQQVNPIAQPSFGNFRSLLGRDFSEVMEILWGAEVGAEITKIFRHTMETGERYISPPFNHARFDLGVEQAFEWETQRVTLPDGGSGVVCYFADVTELRRSNAALQEAKSAAEAANASKDRFLAILSHELRTPLTPVLMTVGAMEQDPDLRPDMREDLAMIKRNVELETKLIDDLLDLSRITSGKVELNFESVDLNAAVQQVCAICRPQLLDQEVRVETDLDRNAGKVRADPARLQQVLWNVLNNAAKFTPPEGIVRVSTRRLPSDRCEVRINDSGRGIPPDVLPRIFDAFEQGHVQITRQFGGLGLGLAISRALVELQAGTIRAESEGPDRGSTFIVEFPSRAADPAGPARQGAESEGADPRQIRILLVEDHPDTARTLARLLTKAGYSVVTVGNVAEATRAAKSEAFDLLVSDLGLPDGDGFEIMRSVREAQKIPGIAMSGYGMDEDIRRSAEAGFIEHLVKPISISKLVASIIRVTENRL